MELRPVVSETGEVEPEGLRWLRLLGPEYLAMADQPIPYRIDNQQAYVRDFPALCGDHARPLFVGLSSINENDSRFEGFRTVARQIFDQHFQPNQGQEK